MPFLTYPSSLELKKELEGTNAEVITLANDEYLESISRWSDTSVKGAVRLPQPPSPLSKIFKSDSTILDPTTDADAMHIKGAVVKVTSTEEVSIVVAFATKRYIPFVVYSGGFNTSGASSTYGGIVINLENMRAVVVNPEAKTVTVQGGARWKDVDTETAPYGIAVVGATANQLSVGGTTLGGGFGWLTGRHGLIIDNLLSVKMVLADASIVTASESEYPDLFWAVRGAGQDFGVATEFTFKSHPQSELVFGGILFFTRDRLGKIVEFANNFEEASDGNQGFFFGFTEYKQETAILVILFYNGKREEAERFFEPILSLDPCHNDSKMMQYCEVNDIVNIAARINGRKRISGTSIRAPLDINFIQEICSNFDLIMAFFPGVGNSLIVFEIIPYAEVVKIPNNATAYANRGKYYNVASIFCWQDEALDTPMRKLQRDLISKIQNELYAHGDGVGVYSNYAGYEASAKDLFGENLPRLQELKKRYDPKNVFRKWHDILLESGPIG